MDLREANSIMSQQIKFGASPDWKKHEEARRVIAAYRRLLRLDEHNWEDVVERAEILRKFPALAREI